MQRMRMSESDDRHQSQVYLVAYSRADLEKVPSRETFGLTIVNAFQVVSGVEVLHWVVSQENHAGASGIKVIPTITLLYS